MTQELREVPYQSPPTHTLLICQSSPSSIILPNLNYHNFLNIASRSIHPIKSKHSPAHHHKPLSPLTPYNPNPRFFCTLNPLFDPLHRNSLFIMSQPYSLLQTLISFQDTNKVSIQILIAHL